MASSSSYSPYAPAHRVQFFPQHYFSGHILFADPTGYFLNGDLHFLLPSQHPLQMPPNYHPTYSPPIQPQHYNIQERHYEWIQEDEVERNPIRRGPRSIQTHHNIQERHNDQLIQEAMIERNPMSTIRRGPRSIQTHHNIRRGPRSRYNNQRDEAMIVDAAVQLPQHNPVRVSVGGLSEKAISKCLKTRKCNEDDDGSNEICTICQDSLMCDQEEEDDDIIGVLNCAHKYHVKCINKWLQLKNLCPLCKTTGLECPQIED